MVIVVLSLLSLAMIAGIGTAMVGQQRREATRQRLAGVETALALYVSQNRRLPCPADGRLNSSDANAGFERPLGGVACQVVTGVAFSQTHGVVPWRTLGLSEPDVTDGWGNRPTFRVAPELVMANAMDFTSCDPGAAVVGTEVNVCSSTCPTGTWPAGCTNPRDVTMTKGLKVRTNTPAVTLVMDPGATVSTGAAYVAISHGENGEGAYNSTGNLQGSTVGSGTLEASNNAANVGFAHQFSRPAA